MTVFLSTSVLTVPSAASEISLGIYEYPPFLGKDLKRGGVLADLSQAIFIHAGYSTRQVSMPFARLVSAARFDEVDVVVGLWHTREREAQFLFSSNSLLSTSVGFYKRSGSRFSLRGHSSPLIVGLPRGYALPTGLDVTRLRLLTLDDDYQALNMVAKGRIDLAIISQDLAGYLFKTQLKEEAHQLEFVSPPLGVEHFYMAVSRNHPNPQQVRGDFDRAFVELLEQGVVQSIILDHGFSDFSSAVTP